MLDLPAGRYEFVLCHDERLGVFRYCSLFSPMTEFADRATALATARAALAALFTAEPAAANVSRRQFLRGGGRAA